MGNKIALGSALSSTIEVEEPKTLEEKVDVLTRNVEDLTRLIHTMSLSKTRRKDFSKDIVFDNANKDGIPTGISLIGSSVKNGIQILTVNIDGYYIGVDKYDSLSAAAEASSGIRRSGWVYWKLPDGRTVKEAFGKR